MKAFLEDLAALELRRITCQPVPVRWVSFHGQHSFSWRSIPFDASAVDQVPESKGFYCFFVGPPGSSLPAVGYPMYLGRTGRTLRKRFQEYLYEKDNSGGRVHVRKFLNVFDGELTFMYTTFDGTDAELVATERKLLDAVIPAYSDLGYSAEVRAGIGAWQ